MMDAFVKSASVWLPGSIGMMALILASGFFSGSETALFYLSRDELRRLRSGNTRERLAADLLSRPTRLLTAILFWNLMVNLTYFALSVVVAQQLVKQGQTAAAGLFSLLGLVTIILFGEVLPKSVAVVFRRPLAPLLSLPLAVTVRVLDPITPTLATISLMIRRAFWPHLGREPYLRAADLERAVEATAQSQDVIALERNVLHNILDLSEITVEEVMRPRGTYLSLEPPIHLQDLQDGVNFGDYLIVRDPDNDEITSVISLSTLTVIPEKNLELAAEQVVFVPWCSHLAYTLQLLRQRVCSVAAVVNEYGGTIGIVTYEDILENIINPEQSRAKRLLNREPVLEVAPGRYHVDGITTLRYLCKRLGIEYEADSEGLVTVAGRLHEELERIPVVGDTITWRDYEMKVIDVVKRGQLRVMLTQLPTSTTQTF